MSLILSTHVRCLTNTYNPISRGSEAVFWSLWVPKLTRARTPLPKYTQLKLKIIIIIIF